MLEIVPQGLHIDFVGKAKYFIALSLLLIILGAVSMVLHGGLNEGIDFSGGTLVQLRFAQPVDLGKVRDALGTIGMGTRIVQYFADEREVLIRAAQLPGVGHAGGTQSQQALQEGLSGQTVDRRRVEVVGAQASSDLRRKALLALFYAALGTVAYISGRFEGKWFISVSLAAILFALTY